ncbi:flavin-containing monooxygenase [Geodermatophilus sp. SYSU D00696]
MSTDTATPPVPDRHDGPGTRTTVVVIGGGATGLAVAAALTRRAVPTVVLERGSAAGAAWRSRYRSLRLNSGRAWSTLPGLRYPHGVPVFPRRDDVVAYLAAYRVHHGIDLRTGVRALRLDRADGRWTVTTTTGPVTATQVVVATGLLARPVLPDELTTPPGPPVVHSADYVDATPYRGRSVLVVGAGSSGMEVAHDLAAGGARRVLLSVRTPPNVLPRSVGGLPGDPVVHLLCRLPPRRADAVANQVRRLTLGDLRGVGLPVPAEGPFTRMRRPGDAGPAVVDRAVVRDLRAGRITVVPAVERLGEDGAHLAGGRTEQVDAVVAATGFRPDLDPLVGHLGVLDGHGVPRALDARPALPGLRFVNFGMRPGLLAAAGPRATAAAAAVLREVSPRR